MFTFQIPFYCYDEEESTDQALKFLKNEYLQKGKLANEYSFGGLFIKIESVVESTIRISHMEVRPDALAFIQKVLSMEGEERIALIQKHRLGQSLSRYAKENPQLKDLMLQLSTQLVNAMASYFFSSGLWKRGGLENSDLDQPELQKVANAPDLRYKRHVTLVFAKDATKEGLSIAPSSRLWGGSNHLPAWVKTKNLLTRELQGQKVYFPLIMSTPPVVQLLTDVAKTYVHFFRANHMQHKIPVFSDFNTVRGLFMSQLEQSLELSEKSYILNGFRTFYPSALPDAKWDELKRTIEKADPITQKMLANVVMSFRMSPEEATAMSLTYLPCGEVKIALDRCLNAYSDLKDETLGSQLKFAAYHISEKSVEKMAICDKCRQVWPAFEALYWSIRESGLNFHEIAKLQ